MTGRRQSHRRRARWVVAALIGIAAAVVQLAAPSSTPRASGVSDTTSLGTENVPVFSPNLHLVGKVVLGDLGGAKASSHSESSSGGCAALGGHCRIVDQQILNHRPPGANVPHLAASPAVAAGTPVGSGQVPGESGFVGLTGVEQAKANANLDLEPPDQGLCAGSGDVAEFINNALRVYSPSGRPLTRVIPSYALFKQPVAAFFSDPRCYFDQPTGRWFFTEFIVGGVDSADKPTSPSLQFIAVSDTSNPLGGYHIWSFDTTDMSQPDCPCFGDYDELGADANGIFITTDEFPTATPGYNGVIVYALSKELLEFYAQSKIKPVLYGYRLDSDPFGSPYILAPTTTPQGARFAPGVEYFVESNGNVFGDNHLVVYALHDTADLATPAPPELTLASVSTERYSFPPNAVQRPGPLPLGKEVQSKAGTIEADFDSAMEATYLKGTIYGELDTGTSTGNDAVDWFQLHPHLGLGKLTVTLVRQGYVRVKGASLLYPYTALASSGTGYLVFSMSGTSTYPSAAYIAYGADGPTGPVHIGGAGAAPEDGFTCYAAFVGPGYGGCRWGDYSMGVASGGRVYLSTEMVPSAPRDILTNWGTFIISAPPPG